MYRWHLASLPAIPAGNSEFDFSNIASDFVPSSLEPGGNLGDKSALKEVNLEPSSTKATVLTTSSSVTSAPAGITAYSASLHSIGKSGTC